MGSPACRHAPRGGRASIQIILELLVAVATATLFGGARMSPTEMFGGSLILAAALIEARRGTEQLVEQKVGVP